MKKKNRYAGVEEQVTKTLRGRELNMKKQKDERREKKDKRSDNQQKERQTDAETDKKINRDVH